MKLMIKNNDNFTLKINEYVIVNYEQEKFPGVVKEIKKGSALVSTMAVSGINKWKWPFTEDKMWYENKDVLETIQPPKQINNRGIFHVPEIIKYYDFEY